MVDEKFHFSLVSPEKELYSGDVDHVIAPGVEGEFGVLPNHAPFMTTLKPGKVRIIIEDEILQYAVRGGFADVTPDGFTLLAEESEALRDLDSDEVANRLAKAKAELQDVEDLETRAELLERVNYLETLEEAIRLGAVT